MSYCCRCCGGSCGCDRNVDEDEGEDEGGARPSPRRNEALVAAAPIWAAFCSSAVADMCAEWPDEGGGGEVNRLRLLAAERHSEGGDGSMEAGGGADRKSGNMDVALCCW